MDKLKLPHGQRVCAPSSPVRERVRERNRERERERGRERECERESEKEGERERERLYLFLKGMAGALAPFIYLVLL